MIEKEFNGCMSVEISTESVVNELEGDTIYYNILSKKKKTSF